MGGAKGTNGGLPTWNMSFQVCGVGPRTPCYTLLRGCAADSKRCAGTAAHHHGVGASIGAGAGVAAGAGAYYYYCSDDYYYYYYYYYYC